MIGKFTPEIENPVPPALAELTVTALVPVEVSVMDWVAGESITTLPKEMVVALMLRISEPVLSCRTKLSVAPPELAVRVTVCCELKEETVALKLALVAFAGTVTELGTATAELLLARLT